MNPPIIIKDTDGPGGVVGGGDEAVVLAPVGRRLERFLHRVEAGVQGGREVRESVFFW